MTRNTMVRTVVVDAINRTLGYMAIAILVSIMLLTVADVSMRCFFNRPILGTTEITQFMMVTLAFFCIVWCTMLGGHIRVDILTKYLKPTPRLISESIYLLLGLGLYFFICWQNFREAKAVQAIGKLSEIRDIPVHPFYLVIAFTCGIVALILLINLTQNIVKAVKR